ncbi:MAG TPA: DUF3572 family protein [Micropepsaceae bacterium]|nr:DUF3572 family protein [Micropepsaceae bacterium]HRK71684.1 DUF3572 family protein [Micropepsaceae bacterium]
MLRQKTSTSAKSAEALAIEAIAFILADDDLIPRFLSATGVDPADLRERLGDSEVLAAAFNFLMSEEATARRFAEEHRLSPEQMQLVLARLTGEAPA